MFATVLHPTSLCMTRQRTATRARDNKRCAQQRLDVEVVGGEDDLEQHLLVDGDELLVPLADVRRPLAVVVLRLVRRGERLAAVVLAVLEHL
jgi:hypothetical protein